MRCRVVGIVWRLLSVRLWGAGFLRDRRGCGSWVSGCDLVVYVVLGMWANESTYKPDSVRRPCGWRDEHPSRPTVASWFKQLPSGLGEQPSNT